MADQQDISRIQANASTGRALNVSALLALKAAQLVANGRITDSD